MSTARIVKGGRKNAIAGLKKEIRKEVRTEFSDRLSNAGFLARVILYMQMLFLIRKRVRTQARTVAPRGGQYLGH